MISFFRNADAGAVRDVLGGDVDAYEQLVRKHWSAARAIAFARLRNDADADDAVQESFVKAYTRLDTLTDPRKFRAWLFTIVRNTSTSLLRKRRDDVPIKEDDAVSAPDPGRDEMRAMVRQQLDTLDEPYREVLLLRYYGGLKVREIADALDISVEAAKKRLQRARDALGSAMAKELAPKDQDIDSNVVKIMGVVAAAAPAWLASQQAAAGVATASTIGIGAALKAATGVVAVAVAATVAVMTIDSDDSNSTTSANTQTADAATVETDETPTLVADTNVDSSDADAAQSTTENSDTESGEHYDLEGILIGVDGDPVPNNEVVLGNLSDTTKPRLKAMSNDEGHFFFEDVPESLYGIMAIAEDSFAAANIRPSNVDGVEELIMQPAGTIAGIVSTATDAGIGNVKIRATQFTPDTGPPISISDAWNELLNYSTNETGQYSIARLWAGKWILDFEHEDHASKRIDGFYVRTGANALDVSLEDGATITGKVIDAKTGAGLAGTTVQFFHRVETGKGGEFEIDRIPSGDFVLSAERESHVQARPTRMVIAAGQTINDVVIEMQRGGQITGRVVDKETSEGVADASIWMYGTRNSVHRSGKSNSRGFYSFAGLPEGEYIISDVNHEDYARYDGDYWERGERITLNVIGEEAATAPDVELYRGVDIGGRVVDADGDPVEGARVHFQMFLTENTRMTNRTSTDENGIFQTSKIRPGINVRLSATHGNFGSAQYGPYSTDVDQLPDVEIVLDRRLTTVVGKLVRGGDNAPIANQNISAYPKTIAGLTDEGRTNSDGEFTWRNLLPGDYNAQLEQDQPGHGGYTSIGFTIPEGVRRYELTLTHGDAPNGEQFAGAVHGPDGKPAVGAGVNVSTGREHGWVRRGGTTDANGAFELAGLPEDAPLTVSVNHESYNSLVEEGYKTGQRGVVFNLTERGAITGKVIDGSTGKPIRAFALRTIETDDENLSRFEMNFATNFVNYHHEEGVFYLDAQQSTAHVIIASADGFARKAISVIGISGETVDVGAIALEKEATISGHVYDSEGKPVANARLFPESLPYNVTKQLSGFAGIGEGLSRTASDGSYSFGNLPAGELTIHAWAEGYSPAETTVTIAPRSNQPLDFTLGKGGSIRATFSHGGEPVQGQIEANVAGMGFLDPQQDRKYTSQYENEVELHGLLPGRWSVAGTKLRTVGEPRTPTVYRDVMVEDALETEIHFDFEAGTGVVEIVASYDGQVYPNIDVKLAMQTPEDYLFWSGTTDENGVCQFIGVPAGQVTASALSHGSQQWPFSGIRTVTMDAAIGGGQLLRLDILNINTSAVTFLESTAPDVDRTAFVLSGHLTDAEIRTMPAYLLYARAVQYVIINAGETQTTMHIPTGTYTAVVRKPDTQFTSTHFTATAGEPATVDLTN